MKWLLDKRKVVHLVDLSFLVFGERGVKANPPDAVGGVLRPVTWSACEEFLTGHGSDSLLLLYVQPYHALTFFELLAKHTIPTLYFEQRRLPIGRNWRSTLSTAVHFLVSNPGLLMKKVLRRVVGYPFPKFNIDYFVMCGMTSELRPPAWMKCYRTAIRSHSYDYGVWHTSLPFAADDPYIVFLDQAYPLHSDYVKIRPSHSRFGVANPFTREKYYPEIESFLQCLSAAFQLPVFIARNSQIQVSL